MMIPLVFALIAYCNMILTSVTVPDIPPIDIYAIEHLTGNLSEALPLVL